MPKIPSDVGRVTWEPSALGDNVKKPLPFYARPQDTPSAIPPHLVKSSETLASSFTKTRLVWISFLLFCLGACLFVCGFFVGSWHTRQKLEKNAEALKPKPVPKVQQRSSTPSNSLPTTSFYYSVQLGALLNRLNAEELAHYLQQENISAKIIVKQRQSAPPLFIVRTQEYPSYMEAKTVAEMLTNKHLLSATVVRDGRKQQP